MQRVLVKVDRASMGNSLEVRVPFLAKEVIRFGLSLRPSRISKNYTLKSILKRTLKLFIPNEVIYKKKKGFSVPMKTWLRGELKEDLINYVFNLSLIHI